MFKKITRTDYPIYMDWYRRFPEVSFFRMTAIGGMSEIDLEVCEKALDTEIFLINRDQTLGFISISSINRNEHNAYCYLYLQELSPQTREAVDVFLKSFCQNNAIFKLQALMLYHDQYTCDLISGVGFELEGRLRKHHYLAGEFIDLWVYGRQMVSREV